jgi:hypothetical protein
LLAVRVFQRSLATNAEILARGILRSAELGADIVNLSLGTSNTGHEAMLRQAVERARSLGTLVVAARESDGAAWLPGSLPGVIQVLLDWTCDRNEIELRASQSDGTLVLAASGYPRPIPGVPPERNLSGVSFAVANVTGFLARLLEEIPAQRIGGWMNALAEERLR